MKVGAVIFKEESLCFGSLILPNIGALIVRIGSWVYYTIIIIRNHQNSIGNYQGPFFTFIPPFRPRVGKNTKRRRLSALALRQHCDDGWSLLELNTCNRVLRFRV